MAERVLIVTADDALARVASALFAAGPGSAVLRERDGAAGLEACERARPDAVVWDGELPDALDRALVARVRACGAAMVVVVASGWRLRHEGGGDREAYRPRSLAAAEREQIEIALRHHGGNRTRAARDLGISRATLINKIRAYVLDL